MGRSLKKGPYVHEALAEKVERLNSAGKKEIINCLLYTSHYHRGVGSLGATGPARVFKGRKMAGRLGGARATSLGLKVIKVDPERNLLMVRGAVPGANHGLVTVRDSVKAKAK